MKSFSSLILILCFFQSSVAFGQKAPVKFGNIPKQDILMTQYESDTTAEAVILCNYGVFSPDDFVFTQHIRIKILKKSGLHRADFAIMSRPLSVKGKTFTMIDGKVESFKLKKESIFYERITDDVYHTKISMPNVKVGSVIDLKFTMNTIPFTWNFQTDIPIRWSELIIRTSSIVNIKKNFTGFERLAESSDWRWVARDMPAVRPEPYVNSVDNYRAKLEMEVATISYSNENGYIFETYADSWETINSRLLDNKWFGKQLGLSLFLGEEKRIIEDQNLEGLDEIQAAYDLIKTRIKWDEREALYATSDLASAYRDRSGNSADVNLILCNFLNKLGYDARPVVMSTRENGMLAHFFPTYRKLNYVIVGVFLNGKQILLDATDEYLPMGMLPVRCLNEYGRTVIYDKSDWVQIQPLHKSNKTVFSNLTLDEYGGLTGTIDYKYSEYAAYDFRKTYGEYNSKEAYIEDYEAENVGLQINKLELTDVEDLYKPVVCKMQISMDNQTESIGDMLYVNPMIMEKLVENPFKLDERKYPVHFPYPIKNRYIINLEIPEGYVVEKLPESLKTALPENAGTFIYQLQQTQNRITLLYTFQLNRIYFNTSAYGMLKEFYKSLYEKHNEMIILKKENSLAQQ
ncbi:MAG: hypothetical protein ACOC3T_04245 [Bacteroidota bacterium]